MTQFPKRQKLFDEWAKSYDQDLEDGESFPFVGYDVVLALMIKMADVRVTHTVLDLGIGTGNLARRLPLPDQQIWGVDFSRSMLDKAREVLPNAHLIQADMAGHDWVNEIQQPFDRILSAYTFHEFPDEEKIKIIINLAGNRLALEGWIVIGDISFMNRAALEWAHGHFTDLWDEEEYYWCAEPLTDALGKAGFSVQYRQVSCCAGVYRLQLSESENPRPKR
jgi:putative AdoMet-dependent methyltransferase